MNWSSLPPRQERQGPGMSPEMTPELETVLPRQLRATANVLSMLTGFATYDALAGAGHSQKDIVAIIARLARCAVG